MENTTEKKTNNKSLYIYTTLIFAVAILMVVISFFGQINLDKKHSSVTGELTASGTISERVSQLSDENRILIETNNSLSKQISDKDILISMLNDKIAALEAKMIDNDGLYRAFNYIKAKDKVSAQKELDLLKVYNFTTEQQIFYDYLQEEIKKIK